MDSTHLSLIEISREEDSLLSLQHSPNASVSLNNNNSSSGKTFFSCSPLLHIPRSHFPATRPTLTPFPIDSMNRENETCAPSSSSRKDGTEGANMSKLETAKLSLEPQQMKRKKKGGGYNLRKSLAWDRAFFTEEGVLDPLELSMLSGNVAKSSGGLLATIQEGRESLCGGLDNAGDSPGLQALEENAFKELPASTPKRGRKIVGILSPKQVSSSTKKEVGSTSAAKRKVLSAHDINRSASKRSGCPRPVASSSVQRLPNLNRTKAGSKGSKVPKPLALKPDNTVVSVASRTSVASARNQKRCQIAQPAINSQKSITAINSQKSIVLKGTSINAKNTVRNAVKSGASVKSIAKPALQHARRNLASLAPEIQPVAHAQDPHVTQANSSLEAGPDRVLPIVTHPEKGHDDRTRKNAVSFSPSSCYNGGNVQDTQTQEAKPSGLRMPSPSLGFFGQSKPSGSHSLPQRSTQPFNLPHSNISNSHKRGNLNPIHQRPPKPSRKIPADSSTGCVVNPSADGKIKSNVGLDIMQKVEMQNQQQFHSILENVHLQCLVDAKPCKMENTHLEDNGLRSTDNTILMQNGSFDQMKKDDCKQRAGVFPKGRNVDVNGLKCSRFVPQPDLQAEVEDISVSNSVESNQRVRDRQYNTCKNTNSVCSESQTVEVNDNSDDCTSKVHGDGLSSIEEVKKQSGEQNVMMKPDTYEVDPASTLDGQRRWMNNGTVFEQNISLNAADTDLEVQDCGASEFKCAYSCNNVAHTEHGTNGAYDLSGELLEGETQLQSVGSNLSVESGRTNLRTSAVDNPNLIIIDDPCEQSAGRADLPNPCFVVEQAVQNNHGSHLNSCLLNGRCSSSVEFLEKDVLQSAKTVESEGTNACEDELKSSCILGSAAPVGNVGDTHIGACSEDASGSKLDIQHLSQSPFVQGKVVSGVTNTREDERAVDKQNDSSMINYVAYSDLQPGIATSSKENGISVPHNVSEQPMEQAALENLFSHEVNQENHYRGACDGILLNESRSSGDSRKFNDGNTANISASSEHGLESSHGLHQCEIMEQATELAGVNNVMGETPIEDAEVHSLGSSSLADGCHSTIKPLVANEISYVVDNFSERSEVHPYLQNLRPVIEEFPPETGGFCLGDNLLHMTGCSVESPERNVLATVYQQSDGCLSESKDLNFCASGLGIDKNAEQVTMDDSMPSSIKILQRSSLPLACNETSSGSVLPDIKNLSQSNLLPEEAVSVSHNDCPSSEWLHHSDCDIYPEKYKDATLSIKRSENEKKHGVLLIKPPAKAVPFSEEWLAAFEAAGEEILTMKGGAVQNSPPDKSPQKAGPWSPVRSYSLKQTLL